MTKYYLDSDMKEVAERLTGKAQGFSGKTLLLTGGCGFLGRQFKAVFEYLNTHILKKPLNVILLDNHISSGVAGETIKDSEFIKVIKHNVIEKFKWEGPIDFIVHAAGIASPYYYRAYPLETLEVSVTGTRNMLELANEKNARFTFFSSSEIYGDPTKGHVPIQESYRGNVSCRGPRACYDESKRVGETLCYIYHTKFGTCTNTIRPFNVFGPGMQEADYRVLPNFASCIKKNKPLHIYGNGTQTRTYCYITDALYGFLLVILNGVPGEAYNIGNTHPELSVLELAQHIESVLKRKLEQEVIEYPDSYPTDEPQRRCPDIRKATIQLEYSPAVDLNEGLTRFLQWTDKTYSAGE